MCREAILECVREDERQSVRLGYTVVASQSIANDVMYLSAYLRVCPSGGVVAVELGAIDDDARDGAGSPTNTC